MSKYIDKIEQSLQSAGISPKRKLTTLIEFEFAGCSITIRDYPRRFCFQVEDGHSWEYIAKNDNRWSQRWNVVSSKQDIPVDAILERKHIHEFNLHTNFQKIEFSENLIIIDDWIALKMPL